MTLSLTDIFRGRSRRVAKDLESHTLSRQITSASSRDRANLPPAENSTSPPSSCSIVPPAFEAGKIGLFITHPAEHSGYIDAQADADIVAVHGLGGSLSRTWGESRSCLEHLLPSSLPSSRFLAYGYDSALAFSKPSSGLDNCATDLLLRLRAIRKRTQAGKRPLIFIAHGLGGVVVKKALILAEDDPQKYWNITKYVKGIIFIGTPHRDSAEEPLSNILGNLISQTRLRQGMRNSIVLNLNQNIELISDASRRFLPLTPCLSIVSFYQEHAEATPVVPRFAATLGIIDEKIHARHTTHHEMCHFPSSQSPDYLYLIDAIKHIIKEEEASHESGLLGVDLLPTRHNSLRRRGSRLMNRLSKKLSESTLKISADNPGRFLHFTRDGESSRPPSAPVSTRSVASPELTVRINGLRRLSMDPESDETFSETFQLPKKTLIKDLGRILRAKIPDIDLTGGCRDIKRYKHIDPAQVDPEWARFEAFGHEVKVTWLDVFTTPVMVTDGKPCYDKSRGLKINHRQTISSYLSQLYPSPVEARIDAVHFNGIRQPFTIGTPSSAIVAGQNGTPDLRIYLRRKIGKASTQNLVDLPFGLQRFPLFDVKPFRHRLPASVVAEGGAFVPLNSEIETVKFGFQCNASKRFLVRFLMKGEGDVAGELAVSDQGLDVISWNKKAFYERNALLPDPDWFDNEQAFPDTKHSSYDDEKDSGFSGSQDSEEDSASQDKVEQQRLSQIHLQIIPKLDVGYHFASTTENVAKQELPGNGKFVPERSQKIFTTYLPDIPSGTRQLDVLRTPEEQGISFGDVIHVKDFRKKLPPRFKTIQDLFKECPMRGQPKDAIDLSLTSMEWSYRIFAKPVTGQAIPLDVFSQTTIYQLKMWLHEREGTSIEDQRLIFAGILLQDDACVCDYDIPKGAHIQLVQREVLEPVSATFMYQGNMYTTDDRCFLVISLKHYIQEQFGIPVEDQRIANGYKEMKDGDTISSENVYEVSTTSDGGERPPKSTDQDAAHEHGSQINPNDLRSWDIANSKIVTLNLLDPETFTEATGLGLPEIPGVKSKNSATARAGGYYTNSNGFPPSSGYDKWLKWRAWGESEAWPEQDTDESESDDESEMEDSEESDTGSPKTEPLLGPPLMVTDIDDSTPPLNYDESQYQL